jgi:hypothetical protein
MWGKPRRSQSIERDHEFEEVPQRGWNTLLNFIPYNEKVVTFLKSQEGNNVRVKIWKDGIVKLGEVHKYFRACARYDKSGLFFDWVMVPIQTMTLLAILQNYWWFIEMSRMDWWVPLYMAASGEIITRNRKSTPLCSRWSLEFDANLQPYLRKIKIAQMVEVLFVVEHEKENKNGLGMNIPNQRSKIKNQECCLDVVQPRYVWAQNFSKLKRNKA